LNMIAYLLRFVLSIADSKLSLVAGFYITFPSPIEINLRSKIRSELVKITYGDS